MLKARVTYISISPVLILAAAIFLSGCGRDSSREKDVIASLSGKNIGWQCATSPVEDGGLVHVACGGVGHCMLAFSQGAGELA